MTSTVIFTDIDGPLASLRALYLLGKQPSRLPQSVPMARFDPVAVAMVVQAATRADARIVVSSSWAVWGLENVRWHFEANGIPWALVHEDWKTPRDIPDRALQIKAWLARHPEVTRWVVLDDGSLDVPNLIRCTTNDGLLMEHWDLLQALLGLEPPRPLVPDHGCHHQWNGVGDGTYECVRCQETAKPGDSHCPWTASPLA